MVELAYRRILAMINEFEIRPGERINEVEVSRKLGVSRTPLREALNRLAIEGFLTTQPSRGFFCKSLDPNEIFQLYQLRTVLEVAGVRLATQNARDEDLQNLRAFLDSTADPRHEPISALVSYDETFHESIMRMSGNMEILRTLKNVNDRIRPIRWIDLNRRGRPATQEEHRHILMMIVGRDADRAAQLMSMHIEKRLDEIDTSIRQLYGDIFVGQALARS
ncbi:GntR family transcriptional regulator [Afifella sp. IM 167]|uniref:GntR family transcriptional regulator n=1 Tax=Afifella sp. IM 167 TaxID=2033586 RepID=UPI001CCD48FE|nr:GntR family transcriptional regulator [Afifella sp. IM 167]MBZ8135153.1 GntR family transcriptional regulator [Afifella sp. IM 167]